MTFQPTNRNIKELIPMPGTSALSMDPRAEWVLGDWYADDITHKGEPMTWASETTDHRVMASARPSGFIVCSPRGMYLRHPKRKDGRKGRIMVFKTHVEAAIKAEAQANV